MIPKTLNAPLNTDTLNIMKRSLPTTTIDKYMKVIDLRKAGLTFEEIAERRSVVSLGDLIEGNGF